MELSQDHDNGPAEFAVPIESEPGLASQVLRFVNSSYFGFSGEISSVKLAITLVGIRTIKNFVLWSAVYNLMPNPRCGPLDLKRLWQDSLRRGLFARLVAKALGVKDAEESFAAALLQDMAVPLLAKELPGPYGSLLEKRLAEKTRLSELERHEFGWTHADAAHVIASQWNLPATFAVLMKRHVEPNVLAEHSGLGPAEFAVVMSALLPASVDDQWSEGPQFEETYRRQGPRLPALRDLLAQVDQQFSEFAPMFRIPVSGKSLVAAFDEISAVAC
jgi:HD-like signal output (HDOD) protein